ncbi:MAG: MFS transporter [Corallococcus sp.]|nr:MFS transporter [Corallococcus sp.]MCM1358990.1 MFS transporter [Corallococcus sp.]MCM1394979.1 MFS transporter [Corallococcus sp.]
MKLNYKRTLLVGFAFFLICAFWQAYDTIIPLMLTNKFGLDQTWSGLIMSLDNILALFLLPLFGALSDRKNTKYGKRTPFIFIGTVCAVLCFVGLTFADNAQLAKLSEGTKEEFWQSNYTVENREYNSITNPIKIENPDEYETDVKKGDALNRYTVRDYAAKVYYGKTYKQLTADEQSTVREWYLGEDTLTYDTYYTYDKETDAYRVCRVKESGGLFGGTKYEYLDGSEVSGARPINAYSALVSDAENQFAKTVTAANGWILAIFIIVLLMTLVSMAVFRSPAVALMPDVTVKPLRSKANAIINLMGTSGGILVLLLGMLFGTGKVANQTMKYTWFVLTVCAIMVVALIIFIFTVKEKKWNAEMLELQGALDAKEAEDAETTGGNAENETSVADTVASDAPNNTDNEKTVAETDGETLSAAKKPKKQRLPKGKLISLILILASVALWYIGYNAITSKYSVYAVNVLNKDYNTTLLIAQAAAIVSYIPVGMLASKIGRKKSILIGVAMLTGAFFGAIFIDSSSPSWLMYILFALAGIAWATINVNSFPMVVELAQGNDIGKYTGYYYTASMAAQVVTPILSGALMDAMGTMGVLFPYATIFVALAFVTMIFVKHGDSKPVAPKDKMEMLGDAD